MVVPCPVHRDGPAVARRCRRARPRRFLAPRITDPGVSMRLLVAVFAVTVLLGGVPLDSAGLFAPTVRTALAAPDPSGFPTEASFRAYWVAAHSETTLWSDPTADAIAVGDVHQWAAFYVLQP